MSSRIGCTVPQQALIESLPNLVSKGLNAFQFHISPPDKAMDGKRLSTEEINLIKQYKKEGIYFVNHGKYIYNFCRPDCDYQVNQLISELKLAGDIGCDVIIHQGKNVKAVGLSRLEAINNYVKNVSEALEATDQKGLYRRVLLENSAQQGTEIGYSLEELAYIYNQFDEKCKRRLGICLDLCHIFVAGVLDVRDGKAVTDFVDKFDKLIGLSHLKCIHFNDSAIPFNGRNDHHGDVLCGFISNPELGGSLEGFKVIAKLAESRQIPIIFETPLKFKNGQLETQLKIVQNLISDKEIDLSTQEHQDLIQLGKNTYSQN